MPLTSTQSAIVVHEPGGVEAMQFTHDYPVLLPQHGYVVVRNAYCGINYVDVYFRNGFYSSPKPEVLGREGSGIVVALGPSVNESHDLREGDRVVWLGTGGYAMYTSVSADKVAKVPDAVSLDIAASCFLSGLTALALVEEAYKVKAGDWALVHAAAGTVGVLMVQILKHLGAKVIGTAGSAEKCQVVTDLGADYVIDYRDSSQKAWPEAVKGITGGVGVDVVYDSVAKDTWEGSLEVVRRKGTIVWFGNASGPVPPLTLHRLAPKCVKIARPTLLGYVATREEFDHYTYQLFDLLTSNKLKPRIHKKYPLSEVQVAHKDLEERSTIGKLLLEPHVRE